MAPATRNQDWRIPFFTIWVGQACSLLGSSLVQFALVWWLTAQTGSATVLAMASLAAVLPGVFLGPFAGALVDRWNRRRVMMVADSLVALATLGLIGLYVLGVMQPWHVYVAMFVRSIVGTFHYPAMAASTSLMVPKAQLTRVAGLNRSLQGAMNIVAPPLGALLIALLPLHGIMAVDVGTALLAVVPLLFVAIPQPRRRSAATAARATLWHDVAEGLRYVWQWPGLSLLLAMATLINFAVNPAFTLMPLLVTQRLGGAALELGWMEAGWGAGVVAGGLILGAWGGFRRRMLTSLSGLILMSLAFVILGLVPAGALVLALAAVAFAGLMNSMTNGPLDAILQSSVAPEMQGRVFTVIGSACTAAMPLGMILAGPLADALGVQAWFLTGGIVGVLMGVAALFIPAITHLEDGRPGAVQPAGSSPS